MGQEEIDKLPQDIYQTGLQARANEEGITIEDAAKIAIKNAKEMHQEDQIPSIERALEILRSNSRGGSDKL